MNVYVYSVFYTILFVYTCMYKFVHIDLYIKNPFLYTISDFFNTNQCVRTCIYKFIHMESYKKQINI
jgi:hypothetical protein